MARLWFDQKTKTSMTTEKHCEQCDKEIEAYGYELQQWSRTRPNTNNILFLCNECFNKQRQYNKLYEVCSGRIVGIVKKIPSTAILIDQQPPSLKPHKQGLSVFEVADVILEDEEIINHAPISLGHDNKTIISYQEKKLLEEKKP